MMLACTYEANLGRSADTLWNMYNRTAPSLFCSSWPRRAGKYPSVHIRQPRQHYHDQITLKGTHLLVILLEAARIPIR